MSIRMIGIDHSLAGLDVRAKFSFTKKSAAEAMEQFKELEGVKGCVLLSTCNRMELWASTTKECEQDLLVWLCHYKGLAPFEYDRYFVKREGREAVEHLFSLACGLKSMILAEDQILTQVREALSLSRENYCADNVLEVLFRSAVDRAIAMLADTGYSLKGKTCMVIGNGEMGRLAALTLKRAGADVTVTVRQYRSGVVNIPEGCRRINYGDRMELFPFCDLVVSATSSPNYTIRRELLDGIVLEHPMILIDLAVPRDIEPSLGEMKQISLYDIDAFRLRGDEGNEAALQQAHRVLDEEMGDFYLWYEGRDLVPRIKHVETKAVEDLNLRIQKILRKLPMEEQEQTMLKQQIDTAVEKVVNKMMFGMKNSMERENFIACLVSLEKLYQKDE